ncbi:hypothetical protein GLP22_07730 [Photobacterium carnosum]|uniref:hypothetical protein n=1 Tax=Photobacterium carnosum TaxID=2023717 RepID=UPI001E64F5AF|nr:hypothetical protein [Photobacterium carnosum]MCD9541097.1 hypothetical protein [Photobacterium carnosum]MCD9546530.1 hypothetical protein [Photobacterium carnosum]
MLAVILILLSVRVYAYDQNKLRMEWQVNLNSIPIVYSKDYLFEASVDSGTFFTIFDLTNDCSQQRYLSNRVLIVNNQPIKFSMSCFEGTPVFEALTSKGVDFIYNEFITKNVVVIGNSKFSAKGFISALKQSEIIKKTAI